LTYDKDKSSILINRDDDDIEQQTQLIIYYSLRNVRMCFVYFLTFLSNIFLNFAENGIWQLDLRYGLPLVFVNISAEKLSSSAENGYFSQCFLFLKSNILFL
jgi:hypothetical protein